MSLGLDLLLELTRRYEEPHRRYHALPHIADMLHRGRDLQLDDVQVAAIWFHDAIYDPRALDNEAQSAALAVGPVLVDLPRVGVAAGRSRLAHRGLATALPM